MDVTIIIPTHGRNAGVAECVYALEHNGADIIVVDDASEKPVVLSSNCARILRHRRHRGRSACINTGLKAAIHDIVLIIDDDVYAAPDMVVRLANEFASCKDQRLAFKPRITWDPDVPMTLTMKWLESAGKLPAPVMLSRSFLLEHGGYDENFGRRSGDTELELRLAQRGFEFKQVETAVAFCHSVLSIHDLVEREFMRGMSAVFLHAKFPRFAPEVERIDMLLQNDAKSAGIQAAVADIAFAEQAKLDTVPTPTAALYAHVCRHYFLRGVLEGLKDIGGIKPQNSSLTAAIFRQAARLETLGELNEARRLFRLVLHQPDRQYWDGAEFHLGSIEAALGNPAAAHAHFTECLRLNPTHHKARRALDKPVRYEEVDANVFERIRQTGRAKPLFILFGDLGRIVTALPVVNALREKFGEVSWLTSPQHAALARASQAGRVYETQSRATIPWNWIHAQDFSHVFFPEPEVNQKEWEQSRINPIDFMAKKCGVGIAAYRPRLEPGAAAVAQAEAFLRDNRLTRRNFVSASSGDGQGRHWPNSNLTKLAQQIGLSTIVFGKPGDPPVPGTIACTDIALDAVAVLIEWSSFYLGPAYGISWIATTTDTPMAVFYDPWQYDGGSRFGEVLHGEKPDIQEWDIYTNLPTVLDHLESVLSASAMRLPRRQDKPAKKHL